MRRDDAHPAGLNQTAVGADTTDAAQTKAVHRIGLEGLGEHCAEEGVYAT